MTELVKIVIEQGLAFLVGLFLVTIVQPETAGGVFLLLVIGIAITNAVTNAVKWFYGRTKPNAEKESRAHDAEDDT
jgi:hypothetical protein